MQHMELKSIFNVILANWFHLDIAIQSDVCTDRTAYAKQYGHYVDQGVKLDGEGADCFIQQSLCSTSVIMLTKTCAFLDS